MKSKKRKFGDIGESITREFLVKHGFKVLESNYLKKWGEIDIVAEKSGIVHFVEVKSVTGSLRPAVSHETKDAFRAEDNLHPAKLARLSRTIQSYLLEKEWEGEWKFDAAIVSIDGDAKKAKIKFIEDITI